MKNQKGGLDPGELAGVLITLLMTWALWEPITTIAGELGNYGGLSSDLFVIIPAIIGIAIIASVWPSGEEDARR